jgi:hypothetical protein
MHTSSGTRTHDRIVRTDENGTCPRLRGHCDRHNLYTITPEIDITNIIINILKINSGIDEDIQNEIVDLHVLEAAMEQNDFQFEQKYYKQTEGLAMRAPTSAVLAEIYYHMFMAP